MCAGGKRNKRFRSVEGGLGGGENAALLKQEILEDIYVFFG